MQTQNIQELKSEQEWSDAWPVLHTLRSDLDRDTFLERREQLLADGYRLFGLTADGKIVSVAGIHIYPHVTRGRDFWIHDLATSEEFRSKGYGLELLRYLEQFAHAQGCARLCVHTRSHRTNAQRFYSTKAGYERYAVVYTHNFS